MFYFHRQEAAVRVIERVLPPSHRLPTLFFEPKIGSNYFWSALPEGPHGRNVLELSAAKFRLG